MVRFLKVSAGGVALAGLAVSWDMYLVQQPGSVSKTQADDQERGAVAGGGDGNLTRVEAKGAEGSGPHGSSAVFCALIAE
jgi:hypothetical protein